MSQRILMIFRTACGAVRCEYGTREMMRDRIRVPLIPSMNPYSFRAPGQPTAAAAPVREFLLCKLSSLDGEAVATYEETMKP